MGSAFTVFLIIIVVVLSLDFIGAIVLCLIENKLKKAHPDNEGKSFAEKATAHVKGKDVYLQVTNGVVTVIDELPAVEVPTEVIKEVEVVKEVDKEVEVVKEVDKEVEAPVESAEQEAPAEKEANEQGRVVFIASEQKQTYLDKLAALDKSTYALYEELVNYLLSKGNVKQHTTNNKTIFKYKTDRLVISTVRRGVITLQFMLLNSSLMRFMRAEGAKQIKVTPVTIRLTDEETLARAKSTADLTLDHLEQERAYNAEQKKAARREARRAKAEAEKAAADTTESADAE